MRGNRERSETGKKSDKRHLCKENTKRIRTRNEIPLMAVNSRSICSRNFE